MSGFAVELMLHTLFMSLGCDDPMLGLQGRTRRHQGVSQGWLIAAPMRDTLIHTDTQKH